MDDSFILQRRLILKLFYFNPPYICNNTDINHENWETDCEK